MTFDEWWENYKIPLYDLDISSVMDIQKRIAKHAWEAALTNTVSADVDRPTSFQGQLAKLF